jgi:hypothetical protein
MSAHDSIFSASPSTPACSAGQHLCSLASVSGTRGYRRPRLAFVGAVTRLVQSGPVGNRYETYPPRLWSDR